jgi:CRISPR-associated endonuclease/helicase Cas3
LLSKAVKQKSDSALGEAARALLRLQTMARIDEEQQPLLVWSLRGGVLLDTGWRLEPAACQVICATPLMWGSRLLLRGYNASRASRNLEGGLLAHDAVAIIDEVHLHRRLLETARAVAGRSNGSLALQVVAMSATQTTAPEQVGLSERDLKDKALRRRVHATKRIELVELEEWDKELERELVDRARAAAGNGTVGVFVNDVPSVLNVAGALSAKGHTVELVCGRLRPVDVARLRKCRPGLLAPSGDSEVAFLVSTQSLEVGVDLDLPAMVTVLASAPALAQRAGRLNRSGQFVESTLTVIAPKALDDGGGRARQAAGPYRSEDQAHALAWLAGLNGSISPATVSASELSLPARPVLPLLRDCELWTLSLTSDPQAADPDPDLYLEDPEEQVGEVYVIARRHLDLDPSVVSAALLECAPRQHELARMRRGKALDRVIKTVAEDAWVMRMQEKAPTALPLEQAGSPHPGDTVVVPDGALVCTCGVVGLGEYKGKPGPLDDVLEEVPTGAARDSIVALPTKDVAPLTEADRILGTRASRKELAEVLEANGESGLAKRVRQHKRLSELELTWCAGEEGVHTGLLVVRDMRPRAEENALSVPDERVSIDVHQAEVEQRMARILEALDAPSEEAPREQLLLAARTHDEGKRHPRFQRRMGAADVSLAKPRPGHTPDRGDGWRHEQFSAAYTAAMSNGDVLATAVVAGSHGCGRLLFDRGADGLLDGWQDCPPAVREWVARLYGPNGEYELLRAAAQRERGVHGLCWLEALLRCADMQVSREGR